jgi:hypothetical protein
VPASSVTPGIRHTKLDFALLLLLGELIFTTHDHRVRMEYRAIRGTTAQDVVSVQTSEAHVPADDDRGRRPTVPGGMVMYRFEIYGEESPDKVTHYYWRLVASGDDREDIVAQSRGFLSLAEAEFEMHALRCGARRAEVEDPQACSQSHEAQATTFRFVPDVTRLRVVTPRWHDLRTQESRLAQRDACAPAARPDRHNREHQPGAAHEPGPAHTETEKPPAQEGRRTTAASAPRTGRGRTRKAT